MCKEVPLGEMTENAPLGFCVGTHSIPKKDSRNMSRQHTPSFGSNRHPPIPKLMAFLRSKDASIGLENFHNYPLGQTHFQSIKVYFSESKRLKFSIKIESGYPHKKATLLRVGRPGVSCRSSRILGFIGKKQGERNN